MKKLFSSKLIRVLLLITVLYVATYGAYIYADGAVSYLPTKEQAPPQSTVSSVLAKININTASKEQLMLLSGIGELTAESIIAYREGYGAFKTIEELTFVSGIGIKTFERLMYSISVVGANPSPSEIRDSAANTPLSSSSADKPNAGAPTFATQSEGSAKININTSGLSELQRITKIGPKTAQAIIDYRKTNGLFSTIEDIMSVSGIGAKTYEKIKDQLTV